jgi:hypothetical protein
MRDSLDKFNTDARKMTLHDVIESYRTVMKGAKGTLSYKLDYLKKFQKSFKASDKVADVTAHDMRVFLKKFEELSHATKNHIITVVREVFATAVEKRCISEDQSPMHSIKFFKVGDEIKRPTPTEEQFRAIVESIRSQKLSDTAKLSANLVEFIGQACLGQAECDRRASAKIFSADWSGHTACLLSMACASQSEPSPSILLICSNESTSLEYASAAKASSAAWPRFWNPAPRSAARSSGISTVRMIA